MRPYSSTRLFLFAGNSGDAPLDISVQVKSDAGAVLRSMPVRLARHASSRLDVFSLLDRAPGVGTTGSLALEYAGAHHSLVAFGELEDNGTGFSANLHMIEAHPEEARTQDVHQATLAVPGVLLGAQRAAMQFPQGTVFTPYLLLHNTVSAARAVNVAAAYTAHGSRVKVPLAPVALQGFATASVDVSPLLATGAAKPDEGSVNLEMSFAGGDGDLDVEAGSTDQTGNYVFEAVPQLEDWTSSRTICYWTVFGDTNTMISLWNWSGAAEDLVLTLYYEGGSYRVPVHLEAGADLDLDVASLRRNAVPDDHGNVIPQNVTEGSAILSGVDGDMARISVASSTATFNVRNGTCTNQCGTCNGMTNVGFSPAEIDLGLGASGQATGIITYNTGYSYNVTNNGNWTSKSPSVASVSSSGMVTGQQVGSSQISFNVNVPVGLGYICMGNQLSCPSTWATGGGGSNVTACPSSITIKALNPVNIGVDLTLHTGYGLVSAMLANPTTTNWSNSRVVESVTPTSSTCPASLNLGIPAIPLSANSSFTFGQGGVLLDKGLLSFPAQYDITYDEHSAYGTANILGQSSPATSTCQSKATQTYWCGGAAIGTFSLTYTFTLGNANGGSATLVSVQKQ